MLLYSIALELNKSLKRKRKHAEEETKVSLGRQDAEVLYLQHNNCASTVPGKQVHGLTVFKEKYECT